MIVMLIHPYEKCIENVNQLERITICYTKPIYKWVLYVHPPGYRTVDAKVLNDAAEKQQRVLLSRQEIKKFLNEKYIENNGSLKK